MALKVADTFAVDGARYQFLAVQVAPKPGRWNEAAKRVDQQVTKDGLPVWLIECLRTDLQDRTSELVSVRIDARTAPEVSGPVVFENLLVRSWSITDRESGNLANAGISLVASGVAAS